MARLSVSRAIEDDFFREYDSLTSRYCNRCSVQCKTLSSQAEAPLCSTSLF